MRKLFVRFGILLLSLLLLSSCGQAMSSGKLKKAGLLIPDTINDQVWGTKGYKGLLKIQSQHNIEVYYKEGMNSQLVVERAVKEFDQKGVNIIFGHGNEYAEYFNQLSPSYPHIHFVSFNGDAENTNTTSLNFEGYAMGFFGGMIAGHMTKTNVIGIIAAYEWQPEIEGFYEGANYENPQVDVMIEYVGNWDDARKAIELLNKITAKGADVIYPAGDGYNVPVIEQVKEKGHYAIGYISDQSDLGESAVLTSTIQHVDVLYELVAERFDKGELKSGNLSFDFQEDVITLGKFSSDVDQEFINNINTAIAEYRKTGELPSK
ncbi:BMP family ABC transporter substrate-binding protein [Bacillus sp. DTU_2020_1000418_1_SI_GHA_SEK_038]|uniref:BMP family ABC transporter substrate-binding protein n=1 Tax=Bacillus sp. DTU_2020_1000418_1_SI_GHA_SEK_038 TaxID=3077585 RepID=UPI0028EA2EEE|nr:BMP family ABC transporter substrate-binding protein [Bacillus sp. DTU_2020_1000418_1_SI_GHA_SEK_038]WNS76854.1 BMP family ABC transporter substrate-binding protein [Bacillus sp. DTU_2020_1000418_1_SI_GHA_SEK_038]